MPAKSKAQQRLFGMVHAYQKGRRGSERLSAKIRELASRVDPEDVEHFAKTKASTLPERKDGKEDKGSKKAAEARISDKPSQSDVVRARVGALIRRIKSESDAAKDVTKARLSPSRHVKKAANPVAWMPAFGLMPGRHFTFVPGQEVFDLSERAREIQDGRGDVKEAAAILLLKAAANPIGGEGRLMMQRAVQGRPVFGSSKQQAGLTRPYPGQMGFYNQRMRQLGAGPQAKAQQRKVTPKAWAKDAIEYALGVVARQQGAFTTPPAQD